MNLVNEIQFQNKVRTHVIRNFIFRQTSKHTQKSTNRYQQLLITYLHRRTSLKARK